MDNSHRDDHHVAMAEMIHFDVTRDQALTMLGAVELQLDALQSRLTKPYGEPVEREAMVVAKAQFDEVRSVLRLVLFG
jgi:hypothetical protein